MVQDVESLRAELNSELLRDRRHLPVFAQRAIQIPQIGTNDGVSSRVAIGPKRRRRKAVRVEPNTM